MPEGDISSESVKSFFQGMASSGIRLKPALRPETVQGCSQQATRTWRTARRRPPASGGKTAAAFRGGKASRTSADGSRCSYSRSFRGRRHRLREASGGTLRGLDALLLVAASEPSEIEKHRVVMDKTDRQVEHPFPDVFIIDIEGKLALRRIGNICVGVIPERGEVVLAARARPGIVPSAP